MIIGYWLNITIACSVAVPLILYPALMTSAVSILDWKPFETPNGKILVAASDTTVGCSGGIRKRVTAWLELILLELGARCAAQSVRRRACGCWRR